MYFSFGFILTIRVARWHSSHRLALKSNCSTHCYHTTALALKDGLLPYLIEFGVQVVQRGSEMRPPGCTSE
jgi:hypothetical protein